LPDDRNIDRIEQVGNRLHVAFSSKITRAVRLAVPQVIPAVPQVIGQLMESRWDDQGHRDDDHRGGLVLAPARPARPQVQNPAL
jgi:hypothetical protein